VTKTLTFVSVFSFKYIDKGLRISLIINQNFIKMSTTKKATTPIEESKTQEKDAPKPVLTVSKPEKVEITEKPKMSVNDRIEAAKNFDQLLKRREVLKEHQDTYQKFRLADTGFGSHIILENEQGAKLPIRNSDALKDIYPYLQARIEQALSRVDDEILKFEV
jgi:predicted aspartyl protease